MLLNRQEIAQRAGWGMITPFAVSSPPGVLSYGLDPQGYTFRLSSSYLSLLSRETRLMDPKGPSEWIPVPPCPCLDLGPKQMLRGYSVEYFTMPPTHTGLIIPKSTYSRHGLTVFGGVCHPGWRGHILVEIINPLPIPIRIYCDEGIATVVFLEGAWATPYQGQFQNQQQKEVA